MSADRDGLGEGLESSTGDPRLLVVLNAVLSVFFGWWIVWGLALIGAMQYSRTTVFVVAIVLFGLTHVVTQP
ncbi:hypothetical protein [Natronobacterium gregoryi]|uniref:DUF8107 domain-containing protein n=2 Tax=Natronobacterium gregoryi TaxID=44930 RepID=L0ALD5_NATGS|nr:hypothetical protein [Natronobacterium gregoryi]AFZ74698.1 hypothetical protein Natgr_3584 [Natronobacterium gregoryi SP2]ELY73397.1 hypothetical protein C490_01490 [Natronobacterium gregoryi SP2]PLK20943.1 hypothetical protein CYV19_06685 [Natronobacterium gregoryi SP2]SFJ04589.1 hypothetical protein SAMN05443661_11260 [Natronobacterium gregoryi]